MHSRALIWGAGPLFTIPSATDPILGTGRVITFLGGGAALHTDAIQAVVEVAWDDLVSHYRLVKLRVEDLGPLVVAIDSHGRSLFEELSHAAQDKLPDLLDGLGAGRAKFLTGG